MYNKLRMLFSKNVKHFIIIFFSIFSFFACQSVIAQQKGNFTGFIFHQETREPLIGASIILKKDPSVGGVSNIEGKFSIKAPPGINTFVIRYTGMTSDTLMINVNPGETIYREIGLKPYISELKGVEIRVGKYDKNIEDLTVSMEVIKATMIESKNTRSIKTILDQTPGLNILDGEAQIRGGSGFTFGVGSKVAVFVDDMSILTGDASRPLWDLIPTENVDQIEVVKGASSVLSGANALSGAIYIRSAYPKLQPQTKVIVFGGFYSTPKNKSAKWWNDFPYLTGVNFLHSRMIKNLDMVIGGNINFDHSYLGPPKPGPKVIDTISDFTNKQMATRWVRFNFNLRYRSKKIQGLNYGINGNIMQNNTNMVLAWIDDTSGFYRAYPGAAILQDQFLFYIDPFANFYSGTGVKHSLKARIFYLNNDMSNNQSNRSTVYFTDYQFHKKYEFLKNLEFTGGLSTQYTNSNAKMYSGGGSPHNTLLNASAYGELEDNFYKTFKLNMGVRVEYFRLNDTVISIKPIFRFGANMKLFQETYMRLSYGQGYRYPTIAERFIKTSMGAIAVFDNPDLVPESSWNAEFGIKQAFKFWKYFGYIDVAAFYQEYKNTIEYLFGFWDPTYTFAVAGFRFLNTGKSKITGIDISVTGMAKIGDDSQLTLVIGYNYILPKTMEPDYVFAHDYNPGGETDFSYNTTSVDPSKSILKYRFLHTIKADLNYQYSRWSFGYTLKYFSKIENLDKSIEEFEQATINSGGSLQPIQYMNYFYHHNNGNVVMDGRISYQFSDYHKIALISENLLNRTYSLRPLKAEQMRTVILQYTLTF